MRSLPLWALAAVSLTTSNAWGRAAASHRAPSKEAAPAAPPAAAPPAAAPPAAAPAAAPEEKTPEKAPSAETTPAPADPAAAPVSPSGDGAAPEETSPTETSPTETSPAESAPPVVAPPAADSAQPVQPAPQPAPPAATQSPEPAPDDDYAGASDAALVEPEEPPKNLSLGVALDVTFPMGKTADFIGSASLQGLSLDLRYYAWGNIGIGLGVALDSLSKKSTETVTWENATFTGTQVRELSLTPLTAKGYYAWRDQERFVPYVAAGVGAARSVKRLVVGYSSLVEAGWHFAFVPEAGLQIPVGPTVILTNVRGNYLPPAGGLEGQFFANFSLGLSVQ